LYISIFWDGNFITTGSFGFTYRLSMLKPRASKSRGPLAKVYYIFDIVIELSDTCWHKLYRRPTREQRKGDEVLCMTKLDALRITIL